MKAHDQLSKIGRGVILTDNGPTDGALLDPKTPRKYVKANNLAQLLGQSEADIAAGRTRPIRAFLREFKNAHSGAATSPAGSVNK